MTYSLKEIGAVIADQRERRKLSQRALAKMAGTSQSRVSKIENGETDPRLSTLIELARVVDLELALVPRRQLPALHAILETPRQTASTKSVPALDRLISLTAQLREKFPENTRLKDLQEATWELSNIRLTNAAQNDVRKIVETVRLAHETPALLNSLNTQVNAIRNLRNRLTHTVSDDSSGPLPAYRLDEDDDE